MKSELIKFLEELEPKYTLQQQSQSILEARYKFKPLFEIMKDQPDSQLEHWIIIDGKKFLYTQTVQEVLDSLKENDHCKDCGQLISCMNCAENSILDATKKLGW